MTLQTNTELRLAQEYVQFTNMHIFLTGKAGTGKTTFLKQLGNITTKRFVVLAPTAVAALNAGGQTIHSFFQLPFGPQIPEGSGKNIPDSSANHAARAAQSQKINREKINLIRSLDLLVIDEISMVRADLLDAIDSVLRRYRHRHLAFGGLQMLMIGDLHQLAPVAKEEEWRFLSAYYPSVYFFSSKVFRQTSFATIELKTIYRQSEQHFIRLLNKIRVSEPDNETIHELNKRYLPEIFENNPEGYITLTTHNNQAQAINDDRLETLTKKPQWFKASIKGDFPEYLFPTLESLELKIGAQVMFVKNDPSPLKQYFNGKIGQVVDFDKQANSVSVVCGEELIEATAIEWQNCRYKLNDQTKEIEEEVIGTFTQIPLRLAWAITIHKSQGLTFDKVIIDAKAAFAHGQVYVALSRCTTLEGMVFRSLIPSSAIKSNSTLTSFIQKAEIDKPDEASLSEAKHAFQLQLVNEMFNFLSIKRGLQHSLKIFKENTVSFEPGTFEKFQNIQSGFEADVLSVSLRFQKQILQLAQKQTDIESNEALQERIQKASSYFAPLIEKIIQHIDIEIETDNKTAKKALQDSLSSLLNELEIALACLLKSKKGFSVSAHLAARAMAAASGKDKKIKAKTKDETGKNKKDVVYLRLKDWRDQLAEEEYTEPYRILPVKTMREIAAKRPTTAKELLAIKGIGKQRAKNFGNQILQLIINIMSEK